MAAVAPLPLSDAIAADQRASTGALLELLPIPAALATLEGGVVRFVAANAAFAAARLDAVGSPSLASALAGRLADAEAFSWDTGDRVERRHYRVSPARLPGAGAPRWLVSLVDRTAELRTADNLRREMATDSLTGLPNRAGFTDAIEAAIARDRAACAVITVDLDRFARVNACLGSMTGDELLITVARRLKGALRAPDVLARTGGDEFGILLALTGADDAEHVAKRVRAAFAEPFRMSDYEVRVGCSLGIAFGAQTDGDPEELIRHAQFAVKRSKASGRAETYQTRAFDAVRARFAMETALRRAIDGGALRLHYQPIRDLQTGAIWAFESLARWTDESGRAWSPAEFIPVAEESGLIVPLGRWALAEAARTLGEWDRRMGGDCGVRVSVNLSAIQLGRDQVVPLVEAALADNGLSGHRLKLELTESALVSEPDRIARAMEALKRLGTTLAMDDFGTGYSSLEYLQKLPIDILKIDKSFVTGMLADRDKVAIVRAILGLAQALGMKTVAEGIETAELGQTLAALGCHYGQGYTFARPLEAEAAYQMIAAERA